ncbi:MAG: DNA polymerase III subunit beta, partial [Pseudomonadota bacterium]
MGVVERRQTMPILSNVLLVARGGRVAVTATDLEVELVAAVDVDVAQEGDITVPGRKLLDICKALPSGVDVKLTMKSERLLMQAGKSRFNLSTLAAAEFPTVEDIGTVDRVTVAQDKIRWLLDKTEFAMAQQDVRYYLNGLLLETSKDGLRAVATDGHRLALADTDIEDGSASGKQVILPRKGVIELRRLLDGDEAIVLEFGANHVRAEIGDIRF